MRLYIETIKTRKYHDNLNKKEAMKVNNAWYLSLHDVQVLVRVPTATTDLNGQPTTSDNNNQQRCKLRI